MSFLKRIRASHFLILLIILQSVVFLSSCTAFIHCETKIEFTLPAGEARIANLGSVTLKVYDVLGSEIRTLVDDVKAPGNYTIIFNASNLSLSKAMDNF